MFTYIYLHIIKPRKSFLQFLIHVCPPGRKQYLFTVSHNSLRVTFPVQKDMDGNIFLRVTLAFIKSDRHRVNDIDMLGNN